MQLRHQPIMPLCHYDLICSFGQLSNPLPRWTPWAGKGAGAANPFSLSLPVSVSLRGEGRRSPLPGCAHSLLLYGLRHSKATLALFGSPGSCLLPPVWGSSLELFRFFSTVCNFPSAPVPWSSSLSHPLGALHKLFSRPGPPFPSSTHHFSGVFFFREVFLDLPQLLVPGMQGEHIRETIMSSQQYYLMLTQSGPCQALF